MAKNKLALSRSWRYPTAPTSDHRRPGRRHADRGRDVGLMTIPYTVAYAATLIKSLVDR